ncbi:HPP family protein [Actinokineospora guangxiensis]|uniref:HPP family protein n=1 Tax=Actinokineospora guangxiensis TaxID=1490288 RepID=A0ABW0EH62_9PSEU
MTTAVRSAMSTRVLGVDPRTSVQVALAVMARSGVRHLPVIDHGRCLGIVSEAAALWHAWAGHGDDRIGACMRAPASQVDQDASLEAAAKAIATSGVDAVVVTADGALVGILTSTDIVRALAG